MSLSRAWPISQEANKSSGICRVCHATRQLHLRDGTVHKHGPRNNPCPGSHQLPLVVSSQSQTGSASVTSPLPPEPPASGHSSILVSNPTPALPVVSIVSNEVPGSSVWSPVYSGLIKHIPRSARPACASHLASLLRAAALHPEVSDNWLAIFDWSGSILLPPKRGGKRHNLASTIKKRICSFSHSSQSVDSVAAPSSRRLSDDAILAQVIAAKLEDGNIRAAIRILCSDDTPAAPSEETLARLQEKHPKSSIIQGSLFAPTVDSALQVVESDVRKAVLSFPAGSSGGPDGFRPQQLKDLVQCRESGADFLSALTAFVNRLQSYLVAARGIWLLFSLAAVFSLLTRNRGAFAPLQLVFLFAALLQSALTLSV